MNSMIWMNNTVKKFLKLINKERDNLFKALKKEYDALYESMQAGLYFETRSRLDNNLILTSEELDKETDKQIDRVYAEFEKTKGAELERLDDLDALSTCYDKRCFFNRYNLLANILQKYKFSESEQADVYAFYFNVTIKYFLNFLINNKDRLLNEIIEAIDNSELFGKKMFRKKIIKDCYEGALNKTKETQGYVSNLRNIISEDGYLLPCENAFEFLWVFSEIDLKAPEDVILLILTESEKRFKTQKEQKELEREAIVNNEHVKKERARKAIQSANEREQANKERRAAVQELKKYLNADTPIRYINDSELLIVIQLLEAANYSQQQILNIKKLIIENNYQITINELNKRLITASERYLSTEEMEILSSACTILNDPNAIQNAAYNTIEEIYNIINGMLIEFIGIDDDNNPVYNDDAELLILYIEELKDNIINYQLSDYRLALVKKD